MIDAADIERMTAEAAAEAEAMLSAIDLEALQRDIEEGAQLLERDLLNDEWQHENTGIDPAGYPADNHEPGFAERL